MNLSDIIAVSRGDKPADILFKNARIINTFNGEIEEGNIAVTGDTIAGIGNYNKATEIVDLKGGYIAPGLINGHSHIESSMLYPGQFTEVVVSRGTSALITDLHEITNVAGIDGIKFVINAIKDLPLDMFFMVPSCVPATNMETSGAIIDAADIRRIFDLPGVIGLGEFMNFPGIIFGDEKVLAKIDAASGKVIDGHAPGVSGNQLNAYIAAGIHSDHECTKIEEAREKLARGMYIMIREGSSEKNLDDLLPLVTDKTYRRCLFVVDDRSCTDLLHEGDIDAVVRKAIRRGLNPVRAIQMATLNTAEYFRLYNRGAIGPGYLANLITIKDLTNLEIDMVYHKGRLVARGGNYLLSKQQKPSIELTDTVHVKSYTIENLKLKTTTVDFPVIEIIPGQIVTKKTIEKITINNGCASADPAKDIAKLVVVERHKASGNIGVGLIKKFGIKNGALASSVAHDSHNIVAIGSNDEDIYTAVKEIEKMHGGLAVCLDGKILAALPLPVAGLLSPDPLRIVVANLEKVEKAANTLGKLPTAPFALLSFLALPVIPELKLTDQGIVDVLQFKIINP
jgi:adenine deaminase